KTDRFKAGSSGAGVADVLMEWGIEDEPAFPLVFDQGPPWSKPDAYRRTSPIFQFDRVKTPTLFHVGGSDRSCPPENSRILSRALAEYLNVPSELLVYPGEPHGLGSYQSRNAKMTWDLAWFGRYIKGETKGQGR